MRGWRGSAALRISLAYTVSFALGVVLLGSAVFWAMHIAFVHQLQSTLREETETLASEYRAGGQQELEDAMAEREAVKVPQHPLYALFSSNGQRIAGSLRTLRPAPGLGTIRFDDPAEGPDEALAVTTDLAPDLRLVVATDREWLERVDQTIITVFAMGFLGVGVLGGIGTFAFAAYLRRRLGTFARSAERVSAGRLSDRMPVSERHDEFDTLAITLNAMLERIETLMANLRQVSSDIAHDLRTPLARLRQKLELAQGIAAGSATELPVTEAITSVDEVLALFAGILNISELESGTQLPTARVDLSALAIDVLETYEPSVREAGRFLDWSIAPGVTVVGNRSLLAQALSNLCENAQHHTPAGTTIRASLTVADGQALLAVSDNGPGVPEADRTRVLKRFERLERSRSTPGFGLGLSLVEAVARRHGGILVLDDAAPGLKATLALPLAAGAVGREAG